MSQEATAALPVEEVLAGIDTMATRRPVAAQIVAVTSSDRTDARDLSRVLVADAALAGRVLKLANSAFFGMGGRVTTLQMAVTVVGFTTVRTLATVALTDPEDATALPEDFWTVSAGVALAASSFAPRFAEYPPDALCLGLLAQLGSVLLHHHDPAGYRELVLAEPDHRRRGTAERERYGTTADELTAAALQRWRFPSTMVAPVRQIEDAASIRGGLLRAAFEAASRVLAPGYEPVPVGPLSCGVLAEKDLPPVLAQLRDEAQAMRRMVVDD